MGGQNDFRPYTREDSDALHYDVRIISDDWDGKIDVKDAYAGNYASAEAVAGQTDIKEELFTPIGWKYNSEIGESLHRRLSGRLQ